jgi:phosphodiesterase/alkaline phosphatase D-like protein
MMRSFYPVPIIPALLAVCQITIAEEVHGPWSGAVTPTSAVVKASLKNTPSDVALLVSTAADLSNPIKYTISPSQSKGGVVGFEAIDLIPATQYHYALEISGVVDKSRICQFQTFPNPGPASFRFAFAACAETGSSHAVFNTIHEEQPLFYMNVGDFHYSDIKKSDSEKFREAYQKILSSPTQSELYRRVPLIYTWDDHDYAGNNSDATSPARATARAIYQEWVPHYPLVEGHGDVPIYQSFVVGRVKFLVSDMRSERSKAGAPDNAGKTMMGAKQKAWFKSELLAARNKYPLIFWINSVPWITPAPEITNTNGEMPNAKDFWGSYATERREIADFIKQNQIQGLCLLSGDAHMLAADDGTNSDFATAGGAPLPVMQAGPLDRPKSLKGGPYSQGTYLPAKGEGCYGLVTVDDQGQQIQVAFSGRNHLKEEKISLKFAIPGNP